MPSCGPATRAPTPSPPAATTPTWRLPLRALIWIGFVGYPPARVDHRFKDGDTIRVGPIALTAHVTGGHTARLHVVVVPGSRR